MLQKISSKCIKSMFVMLILTAILGLVPMKSEAAPKLNKKKATIYVGKTVKLKVKGTSKKVKWSSTKKSICKVNQKGLVTGKKKGKTTIIAKVAGKKYKCVVKVKNTKNLTENEAADVLWKWLEKNRTLHNGEGIMRHGKEGDSYLFQFYYNAGTHISTINWYYVNCKTGKITPMF